MENEFATHLRDNAIYGLWKKDLHRGILFHQTTGMFAQDGTNMLNWADLPSWSWAALGSPVTWDHSARRDHCTYVCDIELDYSRQTLGLQLRGTLLLSPSVYNLLSSVGTFNFTTTGSNKHSFGFSFWVDQWFGSKFGGHKNNLVLAYVSGEGGYSSKEQMDEFLRNIAIMPIMWGIQDRKGHGSLFDVLSLLLHAPPGSERGVYRRVGTVRSYKLCSKDEGFDTSLAEFEQTYRTTLDPHSYQDLNSDGKYTITVI